MEKLTSRLSFHVLNYQVLAQWGKGTVKDACGGEERHSLFCGINDASIQQPGQQHHSHRCTLTVRSQDDGISSAQVLQGTQTLLSVRLSNPSQFSKVLLQALLNGPITV